MKNLDLVSIIIPTYKRNDHLIEAIDSALNQTYSNIEVIVVDDNNPDTDFRKSTESAMLKYQNNNKVKYIKHEKNKNGAAARNTGIRNSKGVFIAFLDDDDVFTPHKIEEQYNFIKNNPEIDCVSCDIYRGGKIQHQKYNEQTAIFDILMLDYSPVTSTLFFRKEALIEINGFDEKYRRHQDLELMIKFLKTKKLGYINKPLITMGINDGENQVSGERLNELKKYFLDDFLDCADLITIPHARKKIICKNYAVVAVEHLKHKNPKLFLKTYITYGVKYPFLYNKTFLNVLFKKIKLKLLKDKD